MKAKIKELLKLFKLSDLLLLIGFIPFIFFLINGQLLMQQSTGKIEVAFPIWVYFIFFGVTLISWSYYLILEFKEGNKPHKAISFIFLGLILFSIIVIAVQPTRFSSDVICRLVNGNNEKLFPGIEVGDRILVEVTYDIYHYLFFAMYITQILAMLYIGLFIFPKRFSGVTFIRFLTYGFYIFLAILIIYGYITEYNKYIPFLQTLFTGNKESLSVYAVYSFIIHRNAYGMCMLMGIIFSYINHALEKKWWYYLIIGFLFINLFFSWCITGILIAVVLTAIYVIYRLIVTFNEHKKRNLALFITAGSIVVIALGIFGIAYISEGKVFGKIYTLIKSITSGGSTISSRVYIWDNIYQMLHDGWWLIGRGFGMFNVVLLEMNKVNGDVVFPAHSSYMNLLAEGGIVYLFAYLAFIGYLGYVIFKCLKKDVGLTLALSFGVLAFMFYSYIEAIEYLVYVFAFPLLIYYHTLKKQEITE